MNGIERDEQDDDTRDHPLEREDDEQRLREGEERQAGGKRPALPEDDRVGPDAAPDVAVVVAEFLRQMAGREHHGEEGGDEETAAIDRGAERIAQEKVQRASGEVRRRTEQRPPLPGEWGEREQRAQRGDAKRDE